MGSIREKIREKIILASSSPRRQELLKQLRIPFTVQAVVVDESVQPGTKPQRMVTELALRKAKAAARKIENGLIVGADTVVVLDGQVLGKPRDREEALQMLKMLSGRSHEVYTGLTLFEARTGESLTTYECTTVHIRPVSGDELQAYVNTGEPLDKAGAYGIQGLGSIFVSEIKGCYFNVVGLPVTSLVSMLRWFGIRVTTYWN